MVPVQGLSSEMFRAEWDGNCRSCHAEFEAGDLVGYVFDDLMCDGCWNEAAEEQASEDTSAVLAVAGQADDVDPAVAAFLAGGLLETPVPEPVGPPVFEDLRQQDHFPLGQEQWHRQAARMGVIQYTDAYPDPHDPDAALADAKAVIVDAITNHPRSQQKQIGPSEIGTDCEHCLAAKLAGWEQKQDVPWLPTIGTAFHEWLENKFNEYQQRTGKTRWLLEARVHVGDIGGQPIHGSTDVLDLEALMTNDWKLVGDTTLKQAKVSPSNVYKIQQQLYAHGWNMAGIKVRNVAISYLPRNAVSLRQAIWWHEPYNPDVALEALERANRVHANITALRTISDAAVDAWITGLPRAAGCWDCRRFADMPTKEDPTYGGLLDD